MPVNKEHLLKVKQHILEKPNRLDMSNWGETDLSPGKDWEDTYTRVVQKVPACGTVACIAGWSAFLRGQEKSIPKLEIDFLGLRSEELFYPTWWPSTLYERYENASTPLEKAQVAAEAIDLIIAGDGVFPEEQVPQDVE